MIAVIYIYLYICVYPYICIDRYRYSQQLPLLGLKTHPHFNSFQRSAEIVLPAISRTLHSTPKGRWGKSETRQTSHNSQLLPSPLESWGSQAVLTSCYPLRPTPQLMRTGCCWPFQGGGAPRGQMTTRKWLKHIAPNCSGPGVASTRWEDLHLPWTWGTARPAEPSPRALHVTVMMKAKVDMG